MKNKTVKVNEYWRTGSRNIELNKTKWDLFKEGAKRFFKKLCWFALIAFVLFATYELGGMLNKQIEYQDKVVEIDNLSKKVAQMKEQILDLIKKGESGTATEDYALISFDPDSKKQEINKASIGLYQWKITTIQYYYRTLYGKTLTNKQAVLVALDEKQSRDLARDVVFKAQGLKNWTNTANKFNLSDKLEVIKSLEK